MRYGDYLRDCMDRLLTETDASDRATNPFVASLRLKLLSKRKAARKLDALSEKHALYEMEKCHYAKLSPKMIAGKIRYKFRRMHEKSLSKDFWK